MITQSFLKEILDYNPDTGDFVWRVSLSSSTKVGGVAGYSNKNGYRLIGIGSRRYFVHRVVWLFMYGKWPEGVVDHINRRRNDNRIINLRDVSVSKNNGNRGIAPRPSVCFRRDRNAWRARLSLGSHSTKEEAIAFSERAISALRESGIL